MKPVFLMVSLQFGYVLKYNTCISDSHKWGKFNPKVREGFRNVHKEKNKNLINKGSNLFLKIYTMKKSISIIGTAITLLFSVHFVEANTRKTTIEIADSSQLQSVYDAYFTVKDALIKSDSKVTSAKAQDLLNAIGAVKMDKLKSNEHNVWMKVVKKLTADAKSISTTTDLKKQRDTFKSLSKNTYELIKSSNPTEAVYYQYCPMADANWLSKEKAVKNPYYGSSMLTCGNVVETIK
jgi:hypothetical protein